METKNSAVEEKEPTPVEKEEVKAEITTPIATEQRAHYLSRQEIEKLTGYYDKDGFYVLPDGDCYDLNGFYFDPEGYDQYGGYYENYAYVPLFFTI